MVCFSKDGCALYSVKDFVYVMQSGVIRGWYSIFKGEYIKNIMEEVVYYFQLFIQCMKHHRVLHNIFVEKVVFGGKGFARVHLPGTSYDKKILFISGGVVPKSVVHVRIIKEYTDYIEGQCIEVVKKSPYELNAPLGGYPSHPGCLWVHVNYEAQLHMKDQIVRESVFHIQKYIDESCIYPIVPSDLIIGYRNKVEFSFGKYISSKEGKAEHFQVGFHKLGDFSKVEDIEGTIFLSEEGNSLFREVKQFCKNSGYPVYDAYKQEGCFRHLTIRQGFFTHQFMIILSLFPKYFSSFQEKKQCIDTLKDFFLSLKEKYTSITSVYLAYNRKKADIAVGDEYECIVGEKYLYERMFDMLFHISPASFFQTNVFCTQKLYSALFNEFDDGVLSQSVVFDLYGGTGSIGMVFSRKAKKVISVESDRSSHEDAKRNVAINTIDSMECVFSDVEDFLSSFEKRGGETYIAVVDPPRAGMSKKSIHMLLLFGFHFIVYVSCNLSTFVRDMELFLQTGQYRVKKCIPFDMFPHTPHIEIVAFLEKIS